MLTIKNNHHLRFAITLLAGCTLESQGKQDLRLITVLAATDRVVGPKFSLMPSFDAIDLSLDDCP